MAMFAKRKTVNLRAIMIKVANLFYIVIVNYISMETRLLGLIISDKPIIK